MNNRSSFALLLALALPTLALVGCSPSVDTGSGGATSSSSGDSTSSVGGAGGDASSSGSTGGGTTTSSSTGGAGFCLGPYVGLPVGAACAPMDPSCHSKTAACLPVHDNVGTTSFGLRMASLQLTAPPSLGKGLVGTVIGNSVTPQNTACNLAGGGTFSWLLAFDTAAGTLTTGGAKPASDPALGYTFVNESLPILGGTLPLAPVTLKAPLGASCQTSSSAADLNMPVYLDAGGTSALALPLRQVRLRDITVSGDHTCIGKYNAAALDPVSNCVADDQTPDFLPGGQVDAFINLEEADSIVIEPLKQTLCVVLTGNAAKFGDGGMPGRCKRTSGKIVFSGDWCTATNQAATAQCKDAVRFAGSFAASGVIIK